MNIIKINPSNPDPKAVKQAADVLTSGGLVVYPTDTAYGLGANALVEKAIKKVYEVKSRNFDKPTHIIVRDWEMICKLCYPNETAKKLYDKFLPGPLTLILKKKDLVPDILTANLKTLGVRIPDNRLTNQLSNYINFPYTTPSANKSGGKTPYSIDEVKNELDISKVDLILDAGKLPPTKPSTIVDVSENKIKILREGPITKSKLDRSL